MLVPYGMGPHVCLAAGIVNTLALLAVGGLLHRLEFDLEPSDYRLGVSVAPFPAPARDFRLRVRKRREPRAAAGRPPGRTPTAMEDLFSELDPEALARAAGRASRESFGPGTVILREGDAADRFCILTSGEVEVLTGHLDENPKVLARIAAPGFFGEIGLLRGVPRTASVRATGPCEALVLERQAFLDLVADTDMTSAEIAAVVHRRWVGATLARALPRLSPDAIRELAPRFAHERHDPGKIIVRQGDAPDRFYLIARGEVDVLNTHPDGREIPLARLGAGEFFGEIGLLQDRPRTATVRAAGEVEVMTLEREDFLAMVSGSGATGEQIAMKVTERLAARMEGRLSSDGGREA
jgi:CRP-like cAMP-binding protein